MKIRNYALPLIAVLLLGGALLSRYGASAAEGDKQPLELTFPGIDGKSTLELADYRGKVVVIDVWATWCGYCVREMPELAAFQKEVEKDKLPVQLIGISVDRNRSDAVAFVKERKITYPMAMGDQKSLKPFGKISGIPVKFIIDKEGVIVDKIVGATDKETLQKRVEKYVKEKYIEEK